MVIDTGNTDATNSIAQQLGARIVTLPWEGYAATKNQANALARYDWVLSLDADEVAHETLVNHIQQVFHNTCQLTEVFAIQRKMVYAGKILRWGATANEWRTRLFNRQLVHWNQQAVHEDVHLPQQVKMSRLSGYVLHYSFINRADHRARLEKYARLFAAQYTNHRVSLMKLYVSPIWNFIKNYVLYAGFLDGKAGLHYALEEMLYTQKKYRYIQQTKID